MTQNGLEIDFQGSFDSEFVQKSIFRPVFSQNLIGNRFTGKFFLKICLEVDFEVTFGSEVVSKPNFKTFLTNGSLF